MPSALVLSSDSNVGESSTAIRIRDAALKCFAHSGIEATSLRTVAFTADVSIGMVQHHFGTKGALVGAVDELMLAIFDTDAIVPGALDFAGLQARMSGLMNRYPDALDYLAYLLIEDRSTGRIIFDRLMRTATDQWKNADVGMVDPTVRPELGACSALVMILGTLILRSHMQRQLGGPFSSPEILQEWERALRSVMTVPATPTPPSLPI